jgi:hypothetical protein
MQVLSVIAGTYFHGNVSDIEVLWVLIATIGVIFSLHNVQESRKDLHALRERNIRNGRHRIAITGLRAEAGRAIVQMIYFTIGAYAMAFPEPPTQHEPFKFSLFRFLFQWGFILSSVILTLKSYWNYELRRDLIEHGIKLEPYETENKDGTPVK